MFTHGTSETEQQARGLAGLMAQIVAHHNEGRHGEALRLCSQSLHTWPDHPGLNHLYAVLCLESGDAHAALTHVQRSLAAQPAQPKVLAVALRAARATGDLALALQFVQRAAALLPDSVALAGDHAALLTDTGQPRAARVMLEAALARDAGHAGARYELGRACRALGDDAAAQAAFEAATQSDSALMPAWFALSLVLEDRHEPALAVEALQRVLALAPDHLEAAINLGLLHQTLGDMDSAMAAYGRAYARRPEALGRIAHALCSRACGALWTSEAALVRALQERAGRSG